MHSLGFCTHNECCCGLYMQCMAPPASILASGQAGWAPTCWPLITGGANGLAHILLYLLINLFTWVRFSWHAVSVFLSVLSSCPSFYLFLSVCVSVWLAACMSVISIYLSVCLSVCVEWNQGSKPACPANQLRDAVTLKHNIYTHTHAHTTESPSLLRYDKIK